ncbi:murein L,D-transpeptidase catalytic domain-containing protein [Klebsiella sp. MISC125]|uniref:murein L,D-transpeptidase catalytic domain-containing protein n=1 Tax=Klebsiella sp. MISC125 TaxID=2755386 RepID=UPI003DA96EC3
MFTKSKIESLQLALKSLELYNGDIDGIVGPLTLAATQKFEAFMVEKPFMGKPMTEEPIPNITKIDNVIDQLGSNIDEALIFTLKNEGGYTNHPADQGGATNKGIILSELSEHLGRKDVTEEELKSISIKAITAIYKKNYWDVLNLDKVLDQSIATALFDMGVLCGAGTALRLCQEILNINITKIMDRQTLDALNKLPDDKFIPLFANKNIELFKKIVANKPSQNVFLKGWINRANRLNSLIDNDSIDVSVPSLISGSTIGEGLYALADSVSIPHNDIKKMIDWQMQNNSVSNPRYWVVFKIKEHSKTQRMHIFDRTDNTVQSVYAVHGTGSDPNNDGLATIFSNTPDSHQSSLGLYKTLSTYTMAKHGRALRLEGLEESNNNAYTRGIVFHGVPYADEEYVNKNGRCGRSYGCPAVAYDIVQSLIDKLKGGSLLLIS